MAGEHSAHAGFKITSGKGFHITFANGWTVSVQFGYGNYCENYSNRDADNEECTSRDAEVAAWDADGKWLRLAEHDDVIGRQSPADVLAIINSVAAMPAVAQVPA